MSRLLAGSGMAAETCVRQNRRGRMRLRLASFGAGCLIAGAALADPTFTWTEPHPGPTTDLNIHLTTSADGSVSGSLTLPTDAQISCPACAPVLVSAGPSIMVTPNPAARGAQIQIAVANDLGAPTDWIAIAPRGAINPCNGGPCADWFYLDGSQKTPSEGAKNPPPITKVCPTTTGDYEVHLSAMNSSFDEAVVVLTVR